MEDQEIVELYFKRAELAISKTQEKYGNALKSILKNRGLSGEDIGECENDVYMAVWNEIPPKRPDSLAAFVYRIALNIGIKKYESNHRQKRFALQVAFDEFEEILFGGNLEDEIIRKEMISAINDYLSELDKENRVLFVQRFWLGVSVKELAKKHGLSVNAVSLRLHKVKEGLRRYLEKESLL